MEKELLEVIFTHLVVAGQALTPKDKIRRRKATMARIKACGGPVQVCANAFESWKRTYASQMKAIKKWQKSNKIVRELNKRMRKMEEDITLTKTANELLQASIKVSHAEATELLRENARLKRELDALKKKRRRGRRS